MPTSDTPDMPESGTTTYDLVIGGSKIRSKFGRCDVEGSPGGLGQTRLKADDLGYRYGSRRIRVKGQGTKRGVATEELANE
jgi:hypothetical protein